MVGAGRRRGAAARLFGEVGLAVADLCAAPGGKTALLAAAGARVTAVDIAPERLHRVRENLTRLKLTAELVLADAAGWAPPARFDAVLLDAPCTATGTLRRHPDILHLKRPSDLDKLAGLQERLLRAAAELVRPGGLLVYCTCSLEPAEGEDQVARFLDGAPGFARVPIAAEEIGGEPDWITTAGDLRTPLPHAAAGAGALGARWLCRGAAPSARVRRDPQLPPRSPCLGRRRGLLGTDVGSLPRRTSPRPAWWRRTWHS